MEILQLAVLRPEMAVLDETDSGLDIDALRTVAEGVNALLAAAARVEPGARLELVLLGQTRDFPHPEPP
jgi:Fe-S cluster assembly ATP-binding protein